MTKINNKVTKEYRAWKGMIKRCYDEEFLKEYPSYNDCSVSDRWKCFQNFWEDLPDLDGYEEWKNNKIPHAYALDKDIKFPGNRIYSKDTCIFVPVTENTNEVNDRLRKKRLNNNSYEGTRLTDGYTEEFVVQVSFAKKYNLDNGGISKCLQGKQKQHKGWKFRIKEEGEIIE